MPGESGNKRKVACPHCGKGRPTIPYFSTEVTVRNPNWVNWHIRHECAVGNDYFLRSLADVNEPESHFPYFAIFRALNRFILTLKLGLFSDWGEIETVSDWF